MSPNIDVRARYGAPQPTPEPCSLIRPLAPNPQPLAPGPWPPTPNPQPLHAHWLGRQSYDDAHALQLELRDQVAAGARPPTLLLLEHEPVITVGRRGELNDLRISTDELERRGVAFRRTERGGRATYHGPGQLVGYLIAPLRALAPDVGTYVCRIEEALIHTAAAMGVEAARRAGQPGVWVGDAKLASIGIAVSRGVCWHGFALNLDPDLQAFDLIRPCGFDLPVTSIVRFTGASLDAESAARLAAQQLAAVFRLELASTEGEPSPLSRLQRFAGLSKEGEATRLHPLPLGAGRGEGVS